ncbi:hypothetical protein CERSUDRAFT_112377 [Gelatoporia subvermispora B]|uniref:Hemerythrin-like domain-containing protein n=1 Tax=Ceriporiopsis subvermispora (strain B) TaxID=914234 RepID=M2RNZ6_CERS8|nr:hypothetical protein CERSUDRAFT_112377 [Gelatoporia subvermispora B]
MMHLENPPKDDLANFIGYCETWAAGIDHHHETEEQVVFPLLRAKLDVSREIEQHKVVHGGVDQILAFLQRAKADHAAFDPAELREMMERLKGPLYEHLDEELEHVKAENLRVLTEKEIQKVNKDLDAYSKNHADPFTVLPFMMSHTPPEFKGAFPAPPLPWILRKVFIPYVFARRHSGYWKYSPYAMS